MRAPDLTLYLVLDPDLCGGSRGMVETARAGVAGGVTVVQLRAPNWKKRAMAECARALLKVLRPAGVPLIIDDHADVAWATGADGVHVGQQDLAAFDCRALLGSDRIIGLSVNTGAECRAVDPGVVDYIGIGPVYATQTKKDAAPALGLSGLARIAAVSPVPSVAIGGIKAAHAAEVMRSGVEGIAVVSAICGRPDPEAAALELMAALGR